MTAPLTPAERRRQNRAMVAAGAHKAAYHRPDYKHESRLPHDWDGGPTRREQVDPDYKMGRCGGSSLSSGMGPQLFLPNYRRHELDELAFPELTSEQESIAAQMRGNRGVESDSAAEYLWGYAGTYSIDAWTPPTGAKNGRPKGLKLSPDALGRVRELIATHHVRIRRETPWKRREPAEQKLIRAAVETVWGDCPELPAGIASHATGTPLRTVQRWWRELQERPARNGAKPSMGEETSRDTSPREGRMIEAIPTDTELTADVQQLERIVGDLFAMALRLKARFPSSEAVTQAVDAFIAQLPAE